MTADYLVDAKADLMVCLMAVKMVDCSAELMVGN